MEPLKNLYNAAFFDSLTTVIKSIVPSFKKKEFLDAVHNSEWENKELKQRIRQVSTTLKDFLPGNYKNQIEVICRIIRLLQKRGADNHFAYICLPDFIEVHGLDDIQTSLEAFEIITQFISCEFAVRPFLLKEPKTVMKRMLAWSKHENPNVRRFSSEGCRPRLPWGKIIPAFIKDPSPILPVLENLKNDPSLFVRKSVANNINDIARDHPDIVLELVKRWKGNSKNTDWILKHGSRTLLKKADPEIYKLFGLSGIHDCEIKHFQLDKKSLAIGETLTLDFALINMAKKGQLFRVELGIYYMKSNGTGTRKLFKITENNFKPDTPYPFKRKISFKDLTTRKHYAGKHSVCIVINGKEIETKHFKVR